MSESVIDRVIALLRNSDYGPSHPGACRPLAVELDEAGLLVDDEIPGEQP